jgi:hypothetical protein
VAVGVASSAYQAVGLARNPVGVAITVGVYAVPTASLDPSA